MLSAAKMWPCRNAKKKCQKIPKIIILWLDQGILLGCIINTQHTYSAWVNCYLMINNVTNHLFALYKFLLTDLICHVSKTKYINCNNYWHLVYISILVQTTGCIQAWSMIKFKLPVLQSKQKLQCIQDSLYLWYNHWSSVNIALHQQPTKGQAKLTKNLGHNEAIFSIWENTSQVFQWSG